MATTLPIEIYLFLFLSRFEVSEEELFACIQQINHQHDSININEICDLALKNGTAGFVYRNVECSGIFPKPAVKHLRGLYSNYLAHNSRLLKETRYLLEVLSDNGIPAIPLKGAIASEILFDDLGVYPSGDIDLLVPPSELAKVKDILCRQCGYTQPVKTTEEDLLASHYHLMFTKNDLLCEVHWNCVKRYFNIPAAFWWEDSREVVQADGTMVSQLSIEKYLLYLIFRLFDHCFYPLRFLVLITGLVSKHSGEISWDSLINLAAQLHMRRLTVFVLCLLHEIQGVDIPHHLTNKKVIGHNLLKRLVFSGIIIGTNNPHLRMATYSLLLDSPSAILSVLLGRLVPSTAELRLRYNIPVASPLIFFYYILNPFIMFFRSRKP